MLNKFKIGHYTDETNGTGATVILCEDGATGGCSVRGSAPATRETDLLKSEKTVSMVNAVVLSGGSAFGLDAAGGVMEYLHEQNKGYNTGAYRVPIVTGASLYDLEYKNFAYPKKEHGYLAAKEAVSNNFIKGQIGAGTGATISKVLGMDLAVKSGLGIQTYSFNNLEVAVIVAVNALGDIVKDNKIIAGVKDPEGNFLDTRKLISVGGIELNHSNTTIGCIITNAVLSKVQANILADMAHDGFALAISPVHTPYDGDAMFCMASNEVKIEFNILCSIVAKLTESAIHSTVIKTEQIDKRVSPTLFKLFQRMWKSKN